MGNLNRTAVAGIGETDYSKDSGRSELRLAAEASLAAIRDAGLSPSDIDGMVTFAMDSNDELELMRSLGVTHLGWAARTPFGGAGANATVQLAASAVASGAAKAVLVYRAFNERSGRRFGQPNPAGGYGGSPGRADFHAAYGLDTPAKIYALWYQVYMQRYGVTNEDLGRYVVQARQYAATNPRAWYYQQPITLDDHQASRWIVEPILRKLDCCQESDGGCALVVTSLERARDLKQPVVRVLGATQSHARGSFIMHNYYKSDLAEQDEMKAQGQMLWNTTGLKPADIDVAMIYENFSPVVLMSLESHGFCKPGEAKDFIADGQIGPGGALPVNTNGGLLGEAYIHGVNNILEGVRQVRGTAANQVPGAETAFVSARHSAIIFGPDG
ncbi:thiolase C-terminal domain-containing protein [Phenylobacterium sp.]|jgi:acetyl-CoA acetyltransferase|uniref:thiolase C-terminal domain-containing protein n=1 Tax=Phenylobacterium sp. TaxID=1871053 RepID=UPI002F3EE96C